MSELRAIGSFAKQLKRVNDGNSSSADVYSVTKYDGFVRSLDYFKKQVFSRDLSSYKIVRKGEFAYSTIHLDEGALGLLEDKEALISPMYTTFQVDESVDRQYIAYLLKSPDLVAHYSLIGQGSINRRKSVAFSSLAELEVFIPPLPEQKKIAEILSGIDRMISIKKQARLGLEAAREAICGELMLKGEWNEEAVGSLATHMTNGFVGTATPHYRERGVRYLTSKNIRRDRIDSSKMIYISEEFHKANQKSTLRVGDVLMVQSGHIGTTAVVTDEYSDCNCHALILMRFNQECMNPHYASL